MAKKKAVRKPKKKREVAIKKSPIQDCKYAWEHLRVDPSGERDGIYVNDRIPAKLFHEIISFVEDENGGKCSQADLVAYARKCKKASHQHHRFWKSFQWDSIRGAQQYRLQQAGLLIRALVVVVTPSDSEESESFRAHVSVTDDGTGRTYTPVFAAINDKEDFDYLWRSIELARNTYIKKLEVLDNFKHARVAIRKLLEHENRGTILLSKVSSDVQKHGNKSTKKTVTTPRRSAAAKKRKPARKTAKKKRA